MNHTLKAVVWRGINKVKLEDIELPNARNGDLILKVKACSVCATDLKSVRKGHALYKPPLVLGHELSGEVVQVGEDVDNFRIGDRVVPAPYVPCGSCFYCVRGLFTMCERLLENSIDPGGFTEYVRVPQPIVRKATVKIPEEIGFEEASLIEPLACVIKSVTSSDVRPGDSVLVVGAGPMGLLHVLACRAAGASIIFLSETNESRLSLGKELGADVVINPTKQPVWASVKDSTSGKGSDSAFITIGNADAIDQAMSSVRRGGSVCMFAGLAPQDAKMPIDLNSVHYSAVRLIGSFGADPYSFHKAGALVVSRRIDVRPLITCKLKLEEYDRAFNLMERQMALKVTLIP